ncbi:putative diguanylate cyclase YfiN (plasmid) [Variovorax sp. PBS-H4]|uniref:GGDEF domain-containing protein n=1 Tax=Variovorax sp. PBS-H4 TaxID=434008 RepID=UPI0013179741|nr:GGDEF domain-containing protein [Variovorax sp. PBS-H4]VTU41403.1 putative diguanylate cyclase YfiN [Variovorax sp. PBS-H4]
MAVLHTLGLIYGISVDAPVRELVGDAVAGGFILAGMGLSVMCRGSVRRWAVFFAMGAAALASLGFGTTLVAHLWALIELMAVAMIVRAFSPGPVGRLTAAALGVLTAALLTTAVTDVPELWQVTFPICVVASSEIFGALLSAVTRAALLDPLTGVYNRTGAVMSAATLLKRFQRSGKLTGVIILDIDNFKAINDTHGHRAGDKVLTQLTEQWTKLLPAESLLARLGGDEFLILTGATDLTQVRQLARHLTQRARYQVSYGVSLGEGSPSSLPDLQDIADQDLYHNKKNPPTANRPDLQNIPRNFPPE